MQLRKVFRPPKNDSSIFAGGLDMTFASARLENDGTGGIDDQFLENNMDWPECY